MVVYKNRSGDSSVRYYYLYGSKIRIRFRGSATHGGITSSTYIYTYSSAGTSVVEYMKRLAISGRGLNTYINRRHPSYSKRY